MKNREFIGLKLLEEALVREPGCLPEHPCALLIPSHEEYHNACNLPSACAVVHRPDRRSDRVLRRSAERG